MARCDGDRPIVYMTNAAIVVRRVVPGRVPREQLVLEVAASIVGAACECLGVAGGKWRGDPPGWVPHPRMA